MKKITSLLLAGVLLLSSCASIVSKRSYPIIINSYPQEAKIIVTDKKGIEVYVGNTPTVLKLKSGSSLFSKARYNVKFIKEGYNIRMVPITFRMDNWVFGNYFASILLLPLLLLGADVVNIIGVAALLGGVIIDGMTGAMYKLDTAFLNETLTRSTSNEK